MTEENFCKIDSSYYGETIDNINQLVYRSFDGEELKEYVEHHLFHQKQLVDESTTKTISDQLDSINFWLKEHSDREKEIEELKSTVKELIEWIENANWDSGIPGESGTTADMCKHNGVSGHELIEKHKS